MIYMVDTLFKNGNYIISISINRFYLNRIQTLNSKEYTRNNNLYRSMVYQ